MFKNGEAAMMVTGSWGINQVVAEDSKIKDVAAIAKFPVFENGKGQRRYMVRSTGLQLCNQ